MHRMRLVGRVLLLSLLIAGPAVAQIECPPDVGLIRFDDVRVKMKVGRSTYELTGALFDFDRNAKPSGKDLFRADDIRIDGVGAGSGEPIWFKMSGGVVTTFLRAFKTVKTRRGACVSPFEVEGVPRLGSNGKLASYIRKVTGFAPNDGPSRDDKMRGEMAGWAEADCKASGHIDEQTLSARLYHRAMRRYGKIGKGKVRRAANDIAKEFALKCARIDRGTFDGYK